MTELLDPDGETRRSICLTETAFYPQAIRLSYDLFNSDPVVPVVPVVPLSAGTPKSVLLDVEFSTRRQTMGLDYVRACSIDLENSQDMMLVAFFEMAGRHGSTTISSPTELEEAIVDAQKNCPELMTSAQEALEVRWSAWIETTDTARVVHVNAKGWHKDGRITLIGWSQSLVALPSPVSSKP
jgi:hypothetical protein